MFAAVSALGEFPSSRQVDRRRLPEQQQSSLSVTHVAAGSHQAARTVVAGDSWTPGHTCGSMLALGLSGASPSPLALAWLMRRSPVMLPIPGASTVSHLEDSIAGAAIELTDEQFRRAERHNRLSRPRHLPRPSSLKALPRSFGVGWAGWPGMAGGPVGRGFVTILRGCGGVAECAARLRVGRGGPPRSLCPGDPLPVHRGHAAPPRPAAIEPSVARRSRADAAARPMLLFPDLPGLGATRPADAGTVGGGPRGPSGATGRGSAEVRALVVAGAQPLPEAVGRRRGRRAPQATSPIGVHRPSPVVTLGFRNFLKDLLLRFFS